MACSSFADSANRRGVMSGPFSADEYLWPATPGRCRGLSHVAALRLKLPVIIQSPRLALMACSSQPRALPWAFTFGPFGVDRCRNAARWDSPGCNPGFVGQ
jgi:hypothetical protein